MPQRAEQIERCKKPQQSEYQAEECSDEREPGIDRLKNHIKRGEENDNSQAVSQKANNRDPKLCLVRHDVLSCRHGITRNNKRIEQHVVPDYHDRESEQAAPAGDFRGCALRIVDHVHAVFIWTVASSSGGTFAPLIKSQSMIASSPNKTGWVAKSGVVVSLKRITP